MKQLFTSLLLVICISLNAQTNIGGTLTKDTKLTLAGSPYTVTSNFGVPFGKTLTIDTGVVINFNGSSQLIVQGSLIAVGSISNSIQFNGKGGIVFQKANLNLSKMRYINLDNTAFRIDGYGVDTCFGDIDFFNFDLLNSEVINNSYNKFYSRLNFFNSTFKSTILNSATSYINVSNSTLSKMYFMSSSKRPINLINNTILGADFLIKNDVAKFNILNCTIDESKFESGTSNTTPQLFIQNSNLQNSFINMKNAIVEIENSLLKYNSKYKYNFGVYSGSGKISYCQFIGEGLTAAITKSSGTILEYVISDCSFLGFKTNVIIEQTNNNVIIKSCNFIDIPQNYIISNLTKNSIVASSNYWAGLHDSMIGIHVLDYWDDILTGEIKFKPTLKIAPDYQPQIVINEIKSTSNLPDLMVVNLDLIGESKFLNKSFNVQNDTIYLTNCYYSSTGRKITKYSDTFNLGKLKFQKYVVQLKSNLSSADNVCNTIYTQTKSVLIEPKLPSITNFRFSYIRPYPLGDFTFSFTRQIDIGSQGNYIYQDGFLRNDTLFFEDCLNFNNSTDKRTYFGKSAIDIFKIGRYEIHYKVRLTADESRCEELTSKVFHSSVFLAYSGHFSEINADTKPVHVSPNPVNNSISFSSPIDKFLLYNSLGKLVMTKEVEVTDSSIDLEPIPNGIYTIEMTLPDGSITRQKLIKN